MALAPGLFGRCISCCVQSGEEFQQRALQQALIARVFQTDTALPLLQPAASLD